MSKAIEAFEGLQLNDVVFSPSGDIYSFWTTRQSWISKKRYENLEKKLEKQYSLHKVELEDDGPSPDKKFEFNGETVLALRTRIPEGNDVSIYQIDISKKYKDKKRLADYLIRIMAGKKEK